MGNPVMEWDSAPNFSQVNIPSLPAPIALKRCDARQAKNFTFVVPVRWVQKSNFSSVLLVSLLSRINLGNPRVFARKT